MLQDRNEFFGLYKRGELRAHIIDFNRGKHFVFYYFGAPANIENIVKDIKIQYGFNNEPKITLDCE